MADTAAAQLRRVLHLIPRLADGEDHPIDEVASDAGTTSRQLMSDFASLTERFNEPKAFVEGVSILVEARNVSMHASHFHRPMRLTMPELCALELGLVLLRRSRTPAEQAPIDRALTRLRQTVSRVPMNDKHDGLRYADLAEAGSAAHLAVLRVAVREHHMVRISYRAGGATEASTRDVCPHSLAFTEQMWYVVSTIENGDLRFFRLDRIESVEQLESSFEPDAELGAKALAAGRAFVSDANEKMVVRYSPRIARWLAEREGKTLDADGGLTIEYALADDSWAIRHVLQYGAEAEILSPPRMRELISAKLAAL